MQTREEALRELNEAIFAGERAAGSMRQVKSKLQNARNFGIWDILGGGLISGLLKHEELGEAQKYLEEAQQDLMVFKRELNDVYIDDSFGIEFGSLSQFFDLFLDNIFVDLFMQSKIKELQEKVEETSGQLERALHRLYEMKRELSR